jgi:hypothetical protein
MNRVAFLGSGAALGTFAGFDVAFAQPTPPVTPAPPGAAHKRASQFFNDSSMNFVLLIVLAQAAFGCGDVGTTLAIFDRIEDGNPGSAYAALTAEGRRIRALADAARAAGHRVSARDLYLQASSYIYVSLYFCDGMGAPERMPATFRESREAADAAFALLGHPVDRIEIPYEKISMPGYFIKPDARNVKRPLLILVNGSDGSVLDMWAQGGKSALERGYNILIFDGPGQGVMLWDRHTFFRPDYEAALTPVVDYALARPDVDPRRIAVQGISQGGFWVPRALAAEHRVAAAIADPGAYDLSQTFWSHLGPPALALLNAGRKAQFDGGFAQLPPNAVAAFTFRARPYGFTSAYDLFMAVKAYTMAGYVDKVRTPLWIANPDNEQFFTGQPKQLFDALPTSQKVLVPFTVAEGADGHCEPATPQLRSQRAFDWLDTQLGYNGEPAA